MAFSRKDQRQLSFLNVLMIDWTMTIEKQECADIAYIDFCKSLLQSELTEATKKLQAYGIKDHLLKWMKSFYQTPSLLEWKCQMQ